jgi:hypothetical protein
VPYGADQTAYLVVDRFSGGSVYRETETERSDLETVMSDFMTGQFNDPVRVVAFNTLESTGQTTFPEMSLKKFKPGATLWASGCPSISEILLIHMPDRRPNWRCG